MIGESRVVSDERKRMESGKSWCIRTQGNKLLQGPAMAQGRHHCHGNDHLIPRARADSSAHPLCGWERGIIPRSVPKMMMMMDVRHMHSTKERLGGSMGQELVLADWVK